MESNLFNIRIKRFVSALIALQFLVFLRPAAALEVGGLYQAEVPVASQTQKERFKVYPSALAQVVVKVSGDRAVPDLPRLSRFMADARLIVQQYHYEELPSNNTALVEEGYKRLLVVRFDRDAITKALIKAEVPLWSHTRPEVLLWLAIEDREARYLLASNASHELESHIEEVAHRRGLPLLLPLVDLEDQQQLKFADVWGDFRRAILSASRRYGVDEVLVGRLYRTPEGAWQSRWSLHHGGEPFTPSEYWQADANMDVDALDAGLNGAADLIAHRYAQLFSTNTAGSVYLNVGHVTDLADYARAMKYLESLDTVTSVEVTRVQADEVQFKLAMRGDLGGLVRTISLGKILNRVEGSAVAGTQGNVMGEALVYQLSP
jgi:hypothetical protein